MTFIDPMTMSIATALVVTVGGVLLLLDTVLYPRTRGARTWAVALMAGILTVFCYLAWTALDEHWVAAALGNSAFVVTTGTMWLGCRRYNLRQMGWSVTVVAAAVFTSMGATLLHGPDGGPWAGAAVMFIALCAFSGLAAVEARRGRLAPQPGSRALSTVMATQCVFYLARTGVYFVAGPDSAIFRDWFGTPSTSMITIVLTITVVVTLAVLRSVERGARGLNPHESLLLDDDGYLDAPSFARVLASYLKRASDRSRVVLVVLHLEDLDRIGAAFGAHHVRRLSSAVREAVHTSAPAPAFLGTDRTHAVLVGIPGVTTGDIDPVVARIARRVQDELQASSSTIVPVLGVGAVAAPGQRAEAASLLRAATAAAEQSAKDLGRTVVVDRPGVG